LHSPPRADLSEDMGDARQRDNNHLSRLDATGLAADRDGRRCRRSFAGQHVRYGTAWFAAVADDRATPW